MSRTSNPDEVDRPATRAGWQAERRQFEETTKSALRRLGESSRAVVNDELRTIETDTAAGTARIRVILLNAWLRPLVVGLMPSSSGSAAGVGG